MNLRLLLFLLGLTASTLFAGPREDLQALKQEISAYFFSTFGPGAADLGLTGKEKSFFGPYALQKGTSYNLRWPAFSPEELRAQEEKYNTFAERLLSLKTGVADLSDDEKVTYNLLVSRVNFERIWFGMDLRYQLTLACPAVLTFTINDLSRIKHDSGIKDSDQRIATLLDALPVFLDGCRRSIEEARQGGRSLAAKLARAGSALLLDAERVTSEIAPEHSAAPKAIAAFRTSIEGWTNNCLSCELFPQPQVYLARWRYGFGRREDPHVVLQDLDRILIESSKKVGRELLSLANPKINADSVAALPDSIILKSYAAWSDTLRAKLKNPNINAEILLREFTTQTKALEQAFGPLFDLPDGYSVRVEESPPQATGAGLIGPGFYGQDRPEARFVVDTTDKGEYHHLFSHKLFAAHETFPGHAAQYGMLRKWGSAIHPLMLLDRSAQVFLADYASKENVEGWGYFAEQLAEEIQPGFYTSEEKIFLEQNRTLRIARAYAELRMQLTGLEPEGAAGLFRYAALLSPEAALQQARLLYRAPGQQGSYYFGRKKIEAIRAEISTLLGRTVWTPDDHRTFHRRFFRYGLAPIGLFSEALLNQYRQEAGLEKRPVPLLEVLDVAAFLNATSEPKR